MTAFRRGARALLRATAASRVTIRLVGVAGEAYLVCEELAQGVPTMMTDAALDPRKYPTYTYLEESRSVLVQDDTRIAAVAPPPDLIAVHNVLAQMLAPIIIDEQLVGTISVHLTGKTRAWTANQIQELEEFRRRIENAFRYASGEESETNL